MPQEIDRLVEDLDHTWETRRSVTQDTANKATDVLIRQKEREKALAVDSPDEALREKYGLNRM
jgi:galactokinase/mevalonate kinase-like predicted kinase